MRPRREGGRWPVVTAVALAWAAAVAAADDRKGPAPAPVRLDVPDAARLEVKAYWDPVKESEYQFHTDWAELKALRPAKEAVTYAGADFRALLPPGPVAPGELWELNRDGLLKFLRQLHPGARLEFHINDNHSRGGGFGCLRAADGRWADVMFRAHAQFALKEGFFTPGRFAGRLVLDRDSGKVAYFRMFLPPAAVNVDLGWQRPFTFEAGGKVIRHTEWGASMAFVPRLELVGGDPEILKVVGRVAGKTEDEVTAAFARRFYLFHGTDWVPFGEALARARKLGKPVHLIALAGALDDESC